MVAARVDDAKLVARMGEVEVHLFNDGLLRVLKVDRDEAAHRAAHLVHEAARLAEIGVFGVLADLGDLHRGRRAARVEAVEHRADDRLERGRRGEAGALEHAGGGVGVEAADAVAEGGKLGGHAADEGGGGVLFTLPHRRVGEVDGVHREARRLDTDDVVVVPAGHRDHVEVDARGQHPSLLVVGVVAAHLGAPRGAEEPDLPARAEELFKLPHRGLIAFPLERRLFAVEIVERPVQPAGSDPGSHLLCLHTISSIVLSCRRSVSDGVPPRAGPSQYL